MRLGKKRWIQREKEGGKGGSGKRQAKLQREGKKEKGR